YSVWGDWAPGGRGRRGAGRGGERRLRGSGRPRPRGRGLSANPGPMALEFAKRIRRIPVYPAADGYALNDDVALLASNESPFRPLPEVVAAAQRAIEGVNRYPDPESST